MDAVSVWVAVGVFAVVVGGQPDVGVQASPDYFETEAQCKAQQAAIRERVANPPEGVTIVGVGLACVKVAVEKVTPAPKVREFSPEEKSGMKKGSI